jgi:hypothetical protein
VVNSDYFQKVFLDRTATNLAERLLNALELFTRVKRRDQSKLRIKGCLTSIFRCALDIKTQVIIGKDIFETIWPAKNSGFESFSMIVVPSQNGPCGRAVSQLRPIRVKLPLVPGLRVYRYDRKSVDCCGFTKGDEGNLGESDLVVPAAVFIEQCHD